AEKLHALGRLAGGVAHDFKNLLTVIMAYVGILPDDIPADAPCQESIVQIEKASEQAVALTRQLLTFTRRQSIQPEVVNLNEKVISLQKMLRRGLGDSIPLAPSLLTSR